MSKSLQAFFITALSGIIGIYLGSAINLEGYLGIIFAISSATGFIISAINNK